MRLLLRVIVMFCVAWSAQAWDTGEAQALERTWKKKTWPKGTWAKGAKIQCRGVSTRSSWKKKGHTCDASPKGEVRVKVRQNPKSLCRTAHNRTMSSLGAGKCDLKKAVCDCELIDEERDQKKSKRAKKRTRRAVSRASRRYKDRHPDGKADAVDTDDNYAPDWKDARSTTSNMDNIYAKNEEAKQGFAGVYDPKNGNLILRPSTPHRESDKLAGTKFYVEILDKPFLFDEVKRRQKTDKSKNPNQHYWVRRGGGHEQLANRIHEGCETKEKCNSKERFDVEFLAEYNKGMQKNVPFKKLNDPTRRKKLYRAFTLIRTGRDPSTKKWTYKISWKSFSVNQFFFMNPRSPNETVPKEEDCVLPKNLRQDVLDAIAYHLPEVFENLKKK